jgi:sodium pump decarboxylase gamma subunit
MAWLGEWWNQVSGTVMHGFELTIVGMALVFFTLGLVILAMVLLTKLPWLQAKETSPQETESPPRPAQAVAAPAPFPADDELARVAAISVAVLWGRRGPRRRARTTGARGSWKRYGRAHQLGL